MYGQNNKEIMESFSSNKYSNKPEWYVLKNGNHIGPITREKVADYFHSGELNDKSLAWRGGNIDWLPINELKEFQNLFEDNNTLPSLPDLREIELEARKELEQNFPKPSLKKTSIHRSTKPDEQVIRKYQENTTERSDLRYESKLDSETQAVFETVSLPDLPAYSLPEMPTSDVEEKENKVNGLQEEQVSEPLRSDNDFSPSLSANKIVKEKAYSGKGGKQFLLLSLVTLVFLVPSVIYLQKVSPFKVNTSTLKPYQSKALESVINLPSSGDLQLQGALDEQGKLFLAINSKSPIKVFGKVDSISNQSTSLNPVSFYFKETSSNGLVKISNPKFEADVKELPTAGKYLIDMQIEKADNFSKLIYSLKKVFILSDLPFIKNFKIRTRYSGSIVLGKGTESENLKLIADFLNNRNQYVEKPILHLKQQLQTLDSIIDQFKEIFFNATTVKKVQQSRKIFSRKFGRELAPILQVITLSNFSEVEFQRSKLNDKFFEIFEGEFERAKLISREISGLAAFVDKRFSEGGNWYSSKRIKHRRLVNIEAKKIKQQIILSINALDELKKKYQIKI